MKKILFFAMMFLSATIMYADKDIKFHTNTGEIKCLAIERIDSVLFDEANDQVLVVLNDRRESFSLSSLDSIKYGILPTGISVTYLGDKAIVENPFAFDSVAVEITGAKVNVRSSSTREIDYSLNGKSDDGCFKIYGIKKYNLILNGVELTNTTGAPLNSQCKKRARVFLADGTTNTLADAGKYSSTAGEDEKATIFSEGQIIFEGEGELSVKGNYKHAICSDDYIEVRGGNITVEKASSDAMHANDSVIVKGGSLSLSAERDGIDCDGYVKLLGGNININAPAEDVKGIKAGRDIIIDGADVSVDIAGDASKGIKSGNNVNIKSGAVAVNATGNTILVDNDPSYATCIKCDSTFNISGGAMLLTASGIAGRGISADVDINFIDGTSCINCSGDSKTYDPTVENNDTTVEEKKSYIVYVSIPTSTNNSPGATTSTWKTVYL